MLVGYLLGALLNQTGCGQYSRPLCVPAASSFCADLLNQDARYYVTLPIKFSSELLRLRRDFCIHLNPANMLNNKNQSKDNFARVCCDYFVLSFIPFQSAISL